MQAGEFFCRAKCYALFYQQTQGNRFIRKLPRSLTMTSRAESAHEDWKGYGQPRMTHGYGCHASAYDAFLSGVVGLSFRPVVTFLNRQEAGHSILDLSPRVQAASGSLLLCKKTVKDTKAYL